MRLRLFHLVRFTLQNSTVQNNQKLLIFSFMGSLSHADKWHHHSHSAEEMSALLHRHVLRGRRLPLWGIDSSKMRWPLTPTFKVATVRAVSRRSCRSHLQGECLKSQSCALSSVCSCYVMLSAPIATRELIKSLICLWLSFFTIFSQLIDVWKRQDDMNVVLDSAASSNAGGGVSVRWWIQWSNICFQWWFKCIALCVYLCVCVWVCVYVFVCPLRLG